MGRGVVKADENPLATAGCGGTSTENVSHLPNSWLPLLGGLVWIINISRHSVTGVQCRVIYWSDHSALM